MIVGCRDTIIYRVKIPFRIWPQRTQLPRLALEEMYHCDPYLNNVPRFLLQYRWIIRIDHLSEEFAACSDRNLPMVSIHLCGSIFAQECI